MPGILIFSKFYLPGYRAGGPIRTLSNLVDRLGDSFAFNIVTTDKDLGEKEPYKSVQHGSWNKVGGAKVLYLERNKINLISLAKIINRASPECIYINSFFDPIFTQRILLLKCIGAIKKCPVILAPRGELSSGALEIKPWRKRLYIAAAKAIGLHKELTFQASSDKERSDILKSIPCACVKIARNLASPEFMPLEACAPRESCPLRVCFLSRISPMKNLDFALSCLKYVTADVNFTIYGPIEDASYWIKCKEVISGLPSNVNVTYEGEIDHSLIQKTLMCHDLFFLPSRGENYGHVILEALSSGLPVLISDKTPWMDLEKSNVGWALSLNSHRLFAEIIDKVAKIDGSDFELLRKRARNYALEKIQDVSSIEANRELFKYAISRSMQQTMHG